jgi:bacterioferritin-associated ferredoxin
MYVCICHGVTDKQIRKAVEQGACTMDALGEELQVGTCCGRCIGCAQGILNQSVLVEFSPGPADPVSQAA